MQLEVGKLYQHGSDNSDERNLYKIVERWAPELFVGVMSDEDGVASLSGMRWMFNSYGHALGYPGNPSGPLNWRLKEYVPAPKWEVAHIYWDTGKVGEFEPIDRSSVWTSRTKYLVREIGQTTDGIVLFEHEEFLDFLDDILD